MTTARAEVVEAPNTAGATRSNRARILEGPHAGARFVIDGASKLGSVVTVAFDPDDQFCSIVRGAVDAETGIGE
ncbi:MAG: hypothetical protein KA310_03225 [Pseudomonadales bacterium]|nr:hypothetical protein [Pseudomonadales bacterium]